MFNPEKENEVGWDQDIRDDVIMEVNIYLWAKTKNHFGSITRTTRKPKIKYVSWEPELIILNFNHIDHDARVT